MFRSSIARKVIRLRSLRSSRHIHSYDQSSPTPLPVLTHLSPSSEPTRPFPLYHPPPPREYIPLTQETLNSLPSDESINRQLKNRLTKKAIEGLPELTEDDLKNFYADLVKTGLSSSADGRLGIEGPEDQLRLPSDKKEKEDILRDLEIRLLGSAPSDSGSSASTSQSSITQDTSLELSNAPTHYKIFAALAQIAIPEDGPSGTSKLPAGASANTSMDIPLGLVSKREWNILFDEFIQRADARGAEALLDVMTLHGVPTEESRVDAIIELDAAAGRVNDVGRLTAEMATSGLSISDTHKDLFVLSLLRHTPSQPQIAISHLTSAEVAGQPYPQSSYQVVLDHLTQPSPIFQPNSHTRALAWDLFTNMRLVAHPTPTRELYTTMIRTCGEASQPEPERARDLWIEMTESEKIQPKREEYSAIIKSLGSTKKDYLEAFDLLRQMLLKHHDATYTPFSDDHAAELLPKFSEYVPTLDTFVGLLEGTKRAGDLNRARWVLTETVKLARTGKMLNSKEWKDGINADLLSGVFMTYASWKPLVRRGAVKMREEEKKEGQSLGNPSPDDAVAAKQSEDTGLEQEEWLDVDVLEELVESSTSNSKEIEEPSGSQSDLPHTPQSSADALREATALFQRVIDDISSKPDANTYLPFKDVKLGPKLVNSYISVHMIHSPSLAATKKAYEDAWASVSKLTKGGVRPNGWSYLQILEKCAHGTRSGITDADRSIAFEWGQSIWQEYLVWFEKASRELDSIHEPSIRERRKWLMGLGDRQTERIWKSSIKLIALYDKPNIHKAMELLNSFYERYPPGDILKSYTPLIEIPNFKIKLSTQSKIPESNVPPYLFFDDLKLLHQTLVKQDKIKELGKLKFIVKNYELNLNKRMKFRFKGVGQNREIMKSKYSERERKRVGKGQVTFGALEEGQREQGFGDEGRKGEVDIDEVD